MSIIRFDVKYTEKEIVTYSVKEFRFYKKDLPDSGTESITYETTLI